MQEAIITTEKRCGSCMKVPQNGVCDCTHVEEEYVRTSLEPEELKLSIYPDIVLRTKTSGLPEERVSSEDFKKIIEGMTAVMYKYKGVGLAAPQVGVSMAVFIMDADYNKSGEQNPEVFINPVIKEYDGGTISLNSPGEGCLSTPYGFRSKVPRSERVKIEWRDMNWELHEEWFEGLEAICVQHEIDHLHGIIFVDRLSGLKQDIFYRKVKKVRKRYMAGYELVEKRLAQAIMLKKRGRSK